MKRHWQYLKYVIRHKWYVYQAARGLCVPRWIAFWHDWDKFLPDEWFAYADYFYGEKVQYPTEKVFNQETGQFEPRMVVPYEVQIAFDHAWNLHQKRNKHHWQFWLLNYDQPKPNFWEQSHDGGMTHSWVANKNGQIAAIIFDDKLDWHKPDWNVVKAMLSDLASAPMPLDMPDVYRREMLADWIGAGKAMGKENTKEWYLANRHKMRLHPNTRHWIEHKLFTEHELAQANGTTQLT